MSFKRTIPNEQYVFFNGGWAEEATRYLIEKALHDLKIPRSKTFRRGFMPEAGTRLSSVVLPTISNGRIRQLEFYLEALDRDVKKENENPSIGIIRCKSANKIVVE